MSHSSNAPNQHQRPYHTRSEERKSKNTWLRGPSWWQKSDIEASVKYCPRADCAHCMCHLRARQNCHNTTTIPFCPFWARPMRNDSRGGMLTTAATLLDGRGGSMQGAHMDSIWRNSTKVKCHTGVEEGVEVIS